MINKEIVIEHLEQQNEEKPIKDMFINFLHTAIFIEHKHKTIQLVDVEKAKYVLSALKKLMINSNIDLINFCVRCDNILKKQEMYIFVGVHLNYNSDNDDDILRLEITHLPIGTIRIDERRPKALILKCVVKNCTKRHQLYEYNNKFGKYNDCVVPGTHYDCPNPMHLYNCLTRDYAFESLYRLLKDKDIQYAIASMKTMQHNRNNNIIAPSSNEYIEVHDTTIRYIGDYNNSSIHRTGSSPCEHIRREHFRTLKSGKRIPIKSSIINKGHTKKAYLIK